MSIIVKQIVETLLLIVETQHPEIQVDFVMNKWNSVYIHGVEYALKLEKRG